MVGEDESHHEVSYNCNRMLVCNDAIALLKHYHICKKFNYLTVMRADFGNVCGPTGAKRSLVGLGVFRIPVNSVPILQFLSMETKAASKPVADAVLTGEGRGK